MCGRKQERVEVCVVLYIKVCCTVNAYQGVVDMSAVKIRNVSQSAFSICLYVSANMSSGKVGGQGEGVRGWVI